MFQVKKSKLVSLAIFLATSAQTFASTTVSCAVEPYGVPPAISLTNPAACSFSGSDEAGVYTSYGVSASASTSASAGASGSVRADSFGDLTFDGLSAFAGSLSSEAALDAHFTSTGPVRLGTLFAASLSRPFVNADSFFNGVSTAFTGFAITQGSFSYHNQCVIVDGDFCSGETIPIYLGLPFTISVQSELSVNWVNNPPSTDYFNYADVGCPTT